MRVEIQKKIFGKFLYLLDMKILINESHGERALEKILNTVLIETFPMIRKITISSETNHFHDMNLYTIGIGIPNDIDKSIHQKIEDEIYHLSKFVINPKKDKIYHIYFH